MSSGCAPIRDEVTALFRDLLIGVTNFFRDAEAFEALEQLVLPSLFAGRDADEALRIWVPGCATGEEAYSLAILVREHMKTLRAPPKIQLFATDIDEAALSVARAGALSRAADGRRLAGTAERLLYRR